MVVRLSRWWPVAQCRLTDRSFVAAQRGRLYVVLDAGHKTNRKPTWIKGGSGENMCRAARASYTHKPGLGTTLCTTRPRIRSSEGARVRGRVHLTQAVHGDQGVHLGRGHRSVSEQLLYDANVGAAVEEMRGERMPQSVRCCLLYT